MANPSGNVTQRVCTLQLQVVNVQTCLQEAELYTAKGEVNATEMNTALYILKVLQAMFKVVMTSRGYSKKKERINLAMIKYCYTG